MPSAQYDSLSYPTHFLKSRVRASGIALLNTKTFLRDKMFDTLFATKRQSIYSKGMFHAPVVTEFIVNV